MTYELAKQLKDAGFPQVASGPIYYCTDLGERTYSLNCEPYDERKCGTHEMIIFLTLSELIEACGEDFYRLTKAKLRWYADGNIENYCVSGSTAEEAVAKLWLVLNPIKVDE